MNSKLLFIGLLGLMLILVGCTQAGGEQAGKATVSKSAVVSKPVAQCVDSDGGQVYSVKGRTTDSSGMKEDVCSDKKTLTEYYCDANRKIAVSETYTCDYLCKDGTCIPQPAAESCTKTGDEVTYIDLNGVTHVNVDSCWDGATSAVPLNLGITTYVCQGNRRMIQNVRCAVNEVCENARCVPVPQFQDLICARAHSSFSVFLYAGDSMPIADNAVVRVDGVGRYSARISVVNPENDAVSLALNLDIGDRFSFDVNGQGYRLSLNSAYSAAWITIDCISSCNLAERAQGFMKAGDFIVIDETYDLRLDRVLSEHTASVSVVHRDTDTPTMSLVMQTKGTWHVQIGNEKYFVVLDRILMDAVNGDSANIIVKVCSAAQ
ncbi:MAG: hypothetical protein ABII22_05350 [Candidatus Micrarchaeota archaeon]